MGTFSLTSEINQPLIIADLANNHSGSKSLARKIILELSQLKSTLNLPICIKYQYRDLETFIHKRFKGNQDYKYVQRFESTKLEWEDFAELTTFAKDKGLLTAATPFDEISVLKVSEHKHDILKVASASATDWGLLELCTDQKIPMLVSVGGLNDNEIEKVISFLKHREANFAIMHCVALYPTGDSQLNIGRISEIKNRFKVTTGYSTHENPKNILAGALAVAAGAEILERHYGKELDGIVLNNYSSGEVEFKNWLENIKLALSMQKDSKFEESIKLQKETLRPLKRGLFAAHDIRANESIEKSNTYSAIPVLDKQILSNDLSLRYSITSKARIQAGEPIYEHNVDIANNYKPIEKILSDTRLALSEISIALNPNVDLEISHHFGIESFYQCGAVLITVINREYAKKIVVMFENQSHPEHFHKMKEESFILLSGKLEVNLDGKEFILKPGDTLVVPRNIKHSMKALENSVFEEISSTNYSNDSFYTLQDELEINRKTKASLWI